MTPNDIDVLLHYYTSPEPHEQVNAPSVREAIASFVEREIFVCRPVVNAYGNSYEVTEKGRKLVVMLCATPDPVHKWLDPREVTP